MEEKKDVWHNYMAMSTVAMAVCAALSTFIGSSYSTQRVIAQTQAANQWSYFQAKNIRSNLYQVRKEALEFELDNLPRNTDRRVLDNYANAIAATESRVRKYEGEKSVIQIDAQMQEQQRDSLQKSSKPFGRAVVLLQVGILLSAVSGLIKRKALWLFSLPLGVLGIIHFANGFFLFM